MTYYEILMWIQEKLISIDDFGIKYVGEGGHIVWQTSDDLIATILEINGCDLVS